MNNSSVIALTLISAVLSGFGVSLLSYYQEQKREKVRKAEKEQDELKLELKDLQIKLYKLEKDLDEWKNKYYTTIQELISVKAELEETLVKLSLINQTIEY
jgi:peptidoglycan hydrolase CwlO-like protein